jgi:hypothetical protein
MIILPFGPQGTYGFWSDSSEHVLSVTFYEDDILPLFLLSLSTRWGGGGTNKLAGIHADASCIVEFDSTLWSTNI